MKQEKIDMIRTYIETNVASLLLEKITTDAFPNATILDAKCDVSELNGHYEGAEFVPPKWYSDLLNNNDYKRALVINGIDVIDKGEQSKFIELLKYRKISTFDIPDNTVIILLANKISDNISSEINSLVATIED